MSSENNPIKRAPEISNRQIELLERLCNACSVSGDEGEVRSIVLEEVKPLAEDVRIDALGNVLVRRSLRPNQGPRVLLSAHMDEVGLMLMAEDGDGLYKIDTVGGLDIRQLVGKPVWVGRDHVPGVIGARPIHLTTADERRKAIGLDNLRIDIGPGGGKVKVGDRATFATAFTQFGESVCAKALDDRLGVATLIELLRADPQGIDLMLAFTVQEEVGLRGAKVAAYAMDPQIAIAVDSTPANDLPVWDGTENYVYNTRLGQGPAIYLADAGTISDPRLVRWLADTGDRFGIPYQYRQPGGGGTDAGAMHRQRTGIPSVSISVPGRYAHTAALIARRSDWENTLALLNAALNGFDPSILER